MTVYERYKRMFEHREADRVPIIDNPWAATLERWRKEGLPEKTNFIDYFDLDHIVRINVDVSPQYEVKVVEETEEYITKTTVWGVTNRNWKHAASTPEFLDFTIKDRASWEEAKKRMTPDKSRIPWESLKKNYKLWREKGYWVETVLRFGFDVTHSGTIGTERMLFAMIEDPDWCRDLFSYPLELNIKLLEMMFDAGYKVDSIKFYDDMGYKGHQFFSMHTYREVLKPYHKRAIEWARSKGSYSHLHSCGDINPFVPELVEMGLDALNPLEVKAGMNPEKIKKEYGDKLVIHGGINAVLWDDIDAMATEIKRIVPILKQSGGYIFSTDHSVPSNVSLENFRYIVNLVKEVGKY